MDDECGFEEFDFSPKFHPGPNTFPVPLGSPNTFMVHNPDILEMFN